MVQIKNVKIPTAGSNDTYTFTVGSREAAADLNVNTADKKFGQGVDYDAVDAINKLTVLEVVEAGDVTKVSKKEYKIGVNVQVNVALLRKHLEKSGIILGLGSRF